jgi:pyruvate ferredoxin oxidoreductase alpha subunit
MKDADRAIICLGSTAGTTRTVVDELRTKGIQAGSVKLRAFRPFPAEELLEIFKTVKVIAVLDRSGAYGAIGGPLFNEVRSALYDFDERPLVVNYIYGLGGRDVPPTLIRKVFDDLDRIILDNKVEETFRFLGVR